MVLDLLPTYFCNDINIEMLEALSFHNSQNL